MGSIDMYDVVCIKNYYIIIMNSFKSRGHTWNYCTEGGTRLREAVEARSQSLLSQTEAIYGIAKTASAPDPASSCLHCSAQYRKNFVQA